MTKHMVFVVDPHPIISFGLVEMVKDIAPFVQVRQFANLREAAGVAVSDPPDMVITDFYLKDVTPENFVGLMETLMPRIPVLISTLDELVMKQLQLHPDDRFMAFSKLSPYPKLVSYLRAGLIAAGIDPHSPVRMPGLVVKRHVGQSSIGVGGGAKPLTYKQVEVLEQIALGLSNKDISEYLVDPAKSIRPA